MQIDRYNHLHFPRDNAPTATGNGSASGALAPGVASPQAGVADAALPDAAAPRAESVVLKIQWPGDATRGRADAAVYAPNRPNVARDDTDTDSQAQAHQRALDRNNGVFTRLTVNPDGVLVAKPQAATESRQPDFVALAVSAMREFSDEAERQKSVAAPAAEPASQAPTGWSKLAARFNVFA